DALGGRLRRLETHAEDLLRRRLGGGRPVGHLDATGLAASTGVHLRLDDDLAAEPLGDPPGLGRRVGDVAIRHRHPELAQQPLGLVLVDLHARPGSGRPPRNLRRSQTIGSKPSAIRSFIGMMPLSVMWMCSGHTSVQHFVMLHSPMPAWRRTNSVRSSVSRGCMSRPATLMKKRGPAKAGLCSSWSRMTWHTSWQRKHSMHLWNSWGRSTSSCIIRYLPSASGGFSRSGGTSRALT